MDIRGVLSHGNSSQSMANKEICILVVNEDLTCCNIVTQMLQLCSYEVLYIGKAGDVLHAIWERKEKLGVVFTNVHRLNLEGFEILQYIERNFNLQTIAMSPDDKMILLPEKGSSFAAYVLKFMDVNDVKNLWRSALEMIARAKNLEAKQETATQRASDIAEASDRSFSSNDETTRVHCNRQRTESIERNEESEDGREDNRTRKKARVVWTREMHQKFVEAIEILGSEKAFPKKIVEVMDVPGLTRENVASHLQKYRMCLKREQESRPSSAYINIQTSAVKQPVLSSAGVSLLSNYSHQTPYFARQLYGTQNQPPSLITAPHAPLDSHHSLGTWPQVFKPNLSFSGAISQKSCLMDFGNSLSIDQRSLVHRQSGYVPRITPQSNFRVYNDERKNVLMSIGRSSSLEATRPSTSGPGTSFLGLRLTGDGRSIEIGSRGLSSNKQVLESEILLPNNIQKQQTLSTNRFSGESVSHFPAAFQESQPSLSVEDYTEENLVQFSPFPFDSGDHFSSETVETILQQQQQQRSLLPLCQAPPTYESSAQSSTDPANFVFLNQTSVASESKFCNSEQLNAVQQFGTSDDENSAQWSSTVFASHQETSLPPLGTPENQTPFPDHLPFNQCVSNQEETQPSVEAILAELDDIQPRGNFDDLLNNQCALNQEFPPPSFQAILAELEDNEPQGDFDDLLNKTGVHSKIAEDFWDSEIDNIFNNII